MKLAILIPALDEALSLPGVLAGIPLGHRVLVCDNGSTDNSAELARAAGVEVLSALRRGYGTAVLAGIAALQAAPPEVVVIWDADLSVDPGDLDALLQPIQEGRADLVLGARLAPDPGALTLQQIWGNRLATALIARRTGVHFADMGPFRAIRYPALMALGMQDPSWGWNVEMQLKALRAGLRVCEVPVHCRQRVGQSKISGSLKGSLRAGFRMIQACWRYR